MTVSIVLDLPLDRISSALQPRTRLARPLPPPRLPLPPLPPPLRRLRPSLALVLLPVVESTMLAVESPLPTLPPRRQTMLLQTVRRSVSLLRHRPRFSILTGPVLQTTVDAVLPAATVAVVLPVVERVAPSTGTPLLARRESPYLRPICNQLSYPSPATPKRRFTRAGEAMRATPS